VKNVSAILISFFILLIHNPALPQNNTLYLMHSIPQANQLNPALKHPCRIYISIPVVSSLRLSIRNTGFGFHDVFFKGSGAQSEDYFLDLKKLDNKLKRVNYALANTDIDLLGVGMQVKEWYITFGISSHSSMQVSYPHDIVSLADDNLDLTTGIIKPVTLRNLDINATAWNSIGISISKEVMPGFRIGARIKYLNGMVNVHTSGSVFNLNTTPDPVTLRAGVNNEIHSSIPVEFGFAPDGHINNFSLEPALHNLAANYLFTGNHGISLDAGLIYNIDDLTQFSASFTDLGFIRWKDRLNTFSVNETFEFSLSDVARFKNSPKQGDFAKALSDSLRNSKRASMAPNRYTTALPFNFYGGITRALSPTLKAGAMTWVEINSGHVRPSLTLSLNFTPFKAFAGTVSYTIMNNKFNQIGGGVAFGHRGAQFYLVTDNIPVRYTKITLPTGTSGDPNAKTPLIIPYNARMLSLRLGMNLFFGCDNVKNRKSTESGNRNRTPRTKSRDICPAYR
jgi:hypothetical protein